MKKYSWKLSLIALAGAVVAGPLGAADVAKGKEVYEKKCAMCHAKDLKGNPAMAKVYKLDPSALSLVSKQVLDQKDADLIATTTKGKGKMPAQGGKISPDDIANSIAYIRSAAAPAK
jgi:mono/diheme cytochrome c family protein